MKKRILSCFMALALCLTLLPATALATDGHAHCLCGKTPHVDIGDHKESTEIPFEKRLHSDDYGDLWIAEGTDIDGKKASTDSSGWLLPAGAYYLQGAVTIDKPIVIREKVTICLNGKTLQSKCEDAGPVFLIERGGELTLTNCNGTGKVMCASYRTGSGTGVQVNSGTFNLYGGTITGNTAEYGGGVYVNNGGTFNMYGGTISGNNATKGGGGVYVSGGKFEMSGGTISGNTADRTDGGVGVYNNATFNMSGGTIKSNTATNTKPSYTTKGGGVGVYQTATFNMSGGTITGNTANQGGGVYVKVTGVSVNSGKFEMNGTSSVNGNTATQNGGGVYVESGTFDMNDGTITGNTASGNTADQGNGGGVYVKSGTFTMNGDASVSSNTATNTGSTTNTTYGGGVYVSNNGTFTVSDKPTVTENTDANSAASNVYLTGSEITITIAGKLNDGASIGVTKTSSTLIATVKKSLSKVLTADDAAKFQSDKAGHEVSVDTPNNQLVLTRTAGTHTHIWTYEANEATITATCKGEGTCDFNKDGGSVTITSPGDLIYNGNPKTAEVTVSDDWRGPVKEEITITYEQKNGDSTYTKISDAPIEVGTYRASITVKDATASKGATASVEYVIRDGTTKPIPVTKITLSPASPKLKVGQTQAMTVVIEPQTATNRNVTWKSSEPDVATVDTNGTVTAKAAGKATITATAADGNGASASCEITVTGGTTPSQPGGSSSGDSGSYDSNPIIKTETKNNPDGSTTKTETRKDGTVTQTTTAKDGSVSKTETKKDGSSVTENKAADGSTGTVKTGKNGQTEANAKVSAKAIENAKKNGKPVKAPVEVEASRNSGTAPTVKVELPQNSGKTEVEIPVSNANAGTVAIIVRPDGTEEILKDSIPTEDGIRLTVDGSATVKIVDNAKNFIDTQNHWAKDEIDFVSARELVNGMSATHYAPDATATRAQLWTILARQNDADLSGGANWYEKAQLWSKDKGISDGTNPDATITRAQMVTMLWRTMGQPAATDKVSFADVPAGSYYAQAVNWAVESGITQGVGGDRFDPNATCTRAQIAAFLARSMK